MLWTLVIAAAFFFLSGLFVRWFCPAPTDGWRPWRTLGLGTAMLAIGWWFTYALPVPSAPPAMHSLTIVATGRHAIAAKSSEVWFRFEVDGKAQPADKFEHAKAWIQRDGYLVSTVGHQPASIVWKGKADDSAKLIFISHPWSGIAQVIWDGREQIVDLYSRGGTPRSIDLLKSQSRFLDYPSRGLLQRWVQVCDALLIGAGLFLLFGPLSRRGGAPATEPVPASRRLDIVIFSAPQWLVSLGLLLVFYPGVMTSDSLDQWHQGSTGLYFDAHPLFHTLLVTGIRHIWNSPAAVALLQATAFAFSTGWLIAITHLATRAPRASAYVASWLCALCPMVVITSVTLWKDVAYASTIVAITAGAVSLAYGSTPSLKQPFSFAAALIVAVAAMLFRYNGGLVVLATIAVLCALIPEMRKVLIWLGLAAVASFVLLSGPAANAIGVRRSHVIYIPAVHHIAAHLAAGQPPSDPVARQLIAEIDATDPAWRYDCASTNPTVFDPRFHVGVAAQHASRLVRIAASLAFTHPLTEARHLACVSSLVWSIAGAPTATGPVYLSRMGIYRAGDEDVWLPKNAEGLREDSLLPALVPWLGAWFERDYPDLVWRPAIYLYALLLAAAVAASRMRNPRIVLALLTAPLLHSLVLAAINVAQDARYQLPVYAIALATIPSLLFARKYVWSGGVTE